MPFQEQSGSALWTQSGQACCTACPSRFSGFASSIEDAQDSFYIARYTTNRKYVL
jgi:hypothetical protein